MISIPCVLVSEGAFFICSSVTALRPKKYHDMGRIYLSRCISTQYPPASYSVPHSYGSGTSLVLWKAFSHFGTCQLPFGLVSLYLIRSPRFPSSVTAFNSNTPLFCDCSWLALMLRRLVVLFSDTHHQTTGDHSSRFNHPHFTSPQSTLIFRCGRDSPLKCAP